METIVRIALTYAVALFCWGIHELWRMLATGDSKPKWTPGIHSRRQ